jgi:hypothetical protein
MGLGECLLGFRQRHGSAADAQIKIRRDRFHGDWNYEIQPRILPARSGYF